MVSLCVPHVIIASSSTTVYAAPAQSSVRPAAMCLSLDCSVVHVRNNTLSTMTTTVSHVQALVVSAHMMQLQKQ